MSKRPTGTPRRRAQPAKPRTADRSAPPSLDDTQRLREYRDATLFRLLLRTWRAHMTATMLRVRARGFEMQPSYPGLLANLDVAGTHITTLAVRSGVTRQAVSQRVQEVEKLGYVTREADPADGRAIIVRFTKRGRLLLKNALEVVAEIEREFEAAIGPTRMQQVKKTLALLLSQIDPKGALGDDLD